MHTNLVWDLRSVLNDLGVSLSSMKGLASVSIALGVATVVASVTAVALDKTLPYRIGILDYGKYLWVGRLAVISVALAVLAFLTGRVARKGWFSRGCAIFGLIPLLLIGGVHSGPNPKMWCFGNLRQIEGAKDQFAQEHGLTNGSPVDPANIFRLMPDGREPRCAKGGRYVINSIGADVRCTFHGTIREIEANP